MKFDKNMKRFVWVAGVAIPLVVAVLFFLPGIEVSPELRSFLNHLPAVNATINGLAFLSLVGSYRAIKRKNLLLHQQLNTAALGLSALFLLSYVSYHITSESTPYCGEGWIRAVYFFVLLSHILLSVVIVPLVLTTYLLGLGQQVEMHRKWARVTWPMWMYVTFTGVVVYLMISPCYPF
ncbi:MAG: DUF420 domain-containing protein [Bacteroidetes bacterium]|jgi:putative membrane protein|nr:DUF420 domain-containing protein [Bacteroidota bacterium]